MPPPRVAFYVLADADEDGRRGYACRLVEKAYQQDNRVVVRCASPDEARDFDQLLWRFSDRSFVPHELLGAGVDTATPVVVLGDAQEPPAGDVLVNLGPDVPPWYGHFGRVAELVAGGEAARREGRERYRFYREQGVEPETHNLGTR